MSANISNIAYLGFRLAPFIIVSCFMLQSIINWDMKGIVYLAGLIMACGLNAAVNNMAGPASDPGAPNPKCGIISLGEDDKFFSKFPISITVYSYTFWFLFMFIVNLARPESNTTLGQITSTDLSTALQANVPILVIFPLLILAEAAWINANQCVPSWLYSVGAMAIGGIIGFMWGLAMVYTNSPNLQYITKPGVEVCSRPTKTLYRCTKKK